MAHLNKSFLRWVVDGDTIDALKFMTPPIEAPFTDLILLAFIPYVFDEDHTISKHESVLLQALDITQEVVMWIAEMKMIN